MDLSSLFRKSSLIAGVAIGHLLLLIILVRQTHQHQLAHFERPSLALVYVQSETRAQPVQTPTLPAASAIATLSPVPEIPASNLPERYSQLSPTAQAPPQEADPAQLLASDEIALVAKILSNTMTAARTNNAHCGLMSATVNIMFQLNDTKQPVNVHVLESTGCSALDQTLAEAMSAAVISPNAITSQTSVWWMTGRIDL